MFNRKKILLIIGYTTFGLVALSVSLFLTVPKDAIMQRIAHEIYTQSQGTMTFSFVDASSYRITGIAAEQVTLKFQGKNDENMVLELASVCARLRILPLFIFRLSVAWSIELPGEGEISGIVSMRSGEKMQIEMTLQHVDLMQQKILAKLLGVPVMGQLSGDVAMAFEKNLSNAKGQAQLQLQTTAAGPGDLKGFSIPRVNIGTLSTEIKIDNGRAKIEKFQHTQGDFTAQMTGQATLRTSLAMSSLDACVKFKFDNNFLEKNSKFQAVLQLAEVSLRKDPGGFLNAPLNGTLSQPKLRSGTCS